MFLVECNGELRENSGRAQNLADEAELCVNEISVVGFGRGMHDSAGDKKTAVPGRCFPLMIGVVFTVLAYTVQMVMRLDDMKGFFRNLEIWK